MKIHKEILDQKSKMERAEREMKSSRKDATQNLNDQEFLSNFDVRRCVPNDYDHQCKMFSQNFRETWKQKKMNNGTMLLCNSLPKW